MEALLDGDPHGLVVTALDEHDLGWLVYTNSAAYARTGAIEDALVGQGVYIVDKVDGRIHHIHVLAVHEDRWVETYREQVRGVRIPDPLPGQVRELLARAGAVAAMRHVRTVAPDFTLAEVKAYVDGVRTRGEPPGDLVERTRPRPSPMPFGITTLT